MVRNRQKAYVIDSDYLILLSFPKVKKVSSSLFGKWKFVSMSHNETPHLDNPH